MHTLTGDVNLYKRDVDRVADGHFPNPITVTPNTTYVVSYHSSGHYASTGNYFASAVSNGPLTAPLSSASGGNGVYLYGARAFPNANLRRDKLLGRRAVHRFGDQRRADGNEPLGRWRATPKTPRST